MFFRLFAVAAFAAGAGLTTAQSTSFISPGCRSALTSLVTNPNAACLNPSVVFSLAPNMSIPNIVTKWVTGLCAKTCSDQALAEVITNVTSGCKAEIASVVGPSYSVPQIIRYARDYYPTARKVMCLKDLSKNQLCITEALLNLQSLLVTLDKCSADNITAKIRSKTLIPAKLVCTHCNKEAYNIVMDLPGDTLQAGLTGILGSRCGAAFTDGTTPADVLQVASGTCWA